jgi:hypothetical protein
MPELLPAATLVFKTLRVGFPDAKVYVYQPRIQACANDIAQAATGAGAKCYFTEYEPHDRWIDHLIDVEASPFWICDTDVVFWKRFEHQPDRSAIAGVRTPEFYEPWTKAYYRERLHTCLMRIDPQKFRSERAAYRTRVIVTPFLPVIELVRQQWQPERRTGQIRNYFYDTLAMAWHAFGGQEFNREQIESFDHLNCATYVDRIAPSLDFDIQAAHKAVYENPDRLRGSWARQFEWFSQHREKKET